jgi:acyl dehydratase
MGCRYIAEPQLIAKGNAMIYLEDLVVGATFKTGFIDVSEHHITRFAQQFDPQPFHLDRERARDTIFGQLVASGWHTTALTMRLIVDGELKLAGGILGFKVDTIEWPRPVRPGDRLHAVSEIEALRLSQSRPDRGVIRVRHTTLNQNDEVVQVLVTNQLVLRKPEAH